MRSVLQTGQRIFTPEMQLSYKKGAGEFSRFGFIVGTNLDKRATARNRMKRLLRESVQHLLPQIVIGTEGVFLVRKHLDDRSEREVEAIVYTLLNRAALLNSPL